MILLGLGANVPSRVGSPAMTLRAALLQLETSGIVPITTSHFFLTRAWPDPDDPPFVNAVVKVRTTLAPAALMESIHAVEAAFGRQRGSRNAPRTLDIDLLDYDGRVSAGLPQLPHPRMDARGFVLIPLAEVAPGWRHPVSARSVESLIAALAPDQRNIQRLEE